MIHGLDSFRLWIALQEASKLIGERGFLGVSTESSNPCVEGMASARRVGVCDVPWIALKS